MNNGDLRTRKTLLNGSDIARDAIKRYLKGREVFSAMQEEDTMYESPIMIIHDRVTKVDSERLEDHIMEEIHRVGVIVDKDELIRAMNYDCRQYHKGYQDGKDAAIAELVHCRECKYCDTSSLGGRYCQLWDVDDCEEAFVAEDDFCSRGERRSE